jgi:hypothetical protein
MDDEAQVSVEETPESVETQETQQAPVENSQPETLLDGIEPAVEEPKEDLIDTPENPDARPEWLPEKFKSPEDLVKAYNEMGAKIREKNEPPESYEIKVGDPESLEPVDLTENDVAAFKEAGLTNEQAQKITDYFYQSVMPDIIEAKASIEKERLAQEWNLGADSNEFTHQLAKVKAWAQQNMPEAAVTELSRTAKGVATLATLMEQGAASHRAVGDNSSPRPNRQQLNDLMNDDRYWNGDEDYREYVRQQFTRAFD